MGIRSAIKELFAPRRQQVLPAPRRRMYEGARVNRLTSDWISAGTSADAEIKSSLPRLRNRSRQLVRDNDYARAAIRAVRNNVIGTGVRMQAQVRMQRGGGRLNEVMNRAIEEVWAQWSRKDSCHTAGRLSFADIERLLISAVAQDGEVFVRLVRQPFGRSRVPFALEIIESDLLDDSYTGSSSIEGNEWRMGVELNRWGRPVQYAFLRKHPGDSSLGGGPLPLAQHRFVPAEEVLHLAITERPGQTRGVPWLASAIQRLHMVSGYEQAEVVRARASSALMGFITSPEAELGSPDEMYGDERVSSFEPGVFKYLPPGSDVKVPQLDAPDGQLEPFLRSMLRAVAAGAGLSYENLSHDFSQTNYSSSRLSLLEERDNWRVLQQWMVENFHQPVFEAWLEMAVLAGVLDLPLYETDPDRYRNVRWFPRGWSWVDPAKEVAAYKDAVRCGFKTQAEVVAEQGGDLEDLLVARKAEVDRAEELDLYFDSNPEIDHETVEDPAMETADVTDNVEEPQTTEASDGPVA